MNHSVEKSLFQATTSTFEDLGFLLPEQQLTEEQEAADLGSAVRIRFEGPFDGCVYVALTGSVLESLTMNMLGDMDRPSESVLQDALGEVANVICGNALPMIAGTREIFHLSAPASEGAASCPDGNLVETIVLGIEEGRVEVSLYTDAALAGMAP